MTQVHCPINFIKKNQSACLFVPLQKDSFPKLKWMKESETEEKNVFKAFDLYLFLSSKGKKYRMKKYTVPWMLSSFDELKYHSFQNELWLQNLFFLGSF